MLRDVMWLIILQLITWTLRNIGSVTDTLHSSWNSLPTEYLLKFYYQAIAEINRLFGQNIVKWYIGASMDINEAESFETSQKNYKVLDTFVSRMEFLFLRYLFLLLRMCKFLWQWKQTFSRKRTFTCATIFNIKNAQRISKCFHLKPYFSLIIYMKVVLISHDISVETKIMVLLTSDFIIKFSIENYVT